MKKLIGFFMAICMAATTLSGVAAASETPVAKTSNSYVSIKGKTDERDNRFLTVALIKNGANPEEITNSDIGFLRQYQVNIDGTYDITFPFDGFTFDDNGQVNNYSLSMHIAGKSVVPTVHEVSGSAALSGTVYVSKGDTVASVLAEVNNLLGTGGATCTLVLSAYSGDNRLLGVIQREQVVAKETIERKHLEMTFPEGTAYVKGFLWSDISGIIPLYQGEAKEKIFGGYDFENPADGEDWYWFGAPDGRKTVVERSDKEAYSGEYSLNLYSYANWCSIQGKQILLPLLKSGNGTYKISAYVKPETSDAQLKAMITYRKPDGGYASAQPKDIPVLKAGEWNLLEQQVTLELDGTESEAYIEIKTIDAYYQNLWIDDIKLEPVGAVNPIKNREDKAMIYMVGDSQCTNYEFDEAANTIQGWGVYLGKKFSGNAVAANCGTGGYDTGDFLYGETADWGQYGERWSTIYGLADENDYVLICLGANDYFHGFSHEKHLGNLMRMVNDVKAKGATPVLILPTPIIGNGTNGLINFWTSDDKIQRTDAFSNLVNAVKTLEDVIVLDARGAMSDYIDQMGRGYTEANLFVADRIHFTHTGAKEFANIIAKLIKAEPELSELAELMK